MKINIKNNEVVNVYEFNEKGSKDYKDLKKRLNISFEINSLNFDLDKPTLYIEANRKQFVKDLSSETVATLRTEKDPTKIFQTALSITPSRSPIIECKNSTEPESEAITESKSEDKSVKSPQKKSISNEESNNYYLSIKNSSRGIGYGKKKVELEKPNFSLCNKEELFNLSEKCTAQIITVQKALLQNPGAEERDRLNKEYKSLMDYQQQIVTQLRSLKK